MTKLQTSFKQIMFACNRSVMNIFVKLQKITQ